jgi:hypothetical protein
MHKVKLRPRSLGFIIATRAALGVGIGLLAATKLPLGVRRILGVSLLALGGITTIPAMRMIARGARAF